MLLSSLLCNNTVEPLQSVLRNPTLVAHINAYCLNNNDDVFDTYYITVSKRIVTVQADRRAMRLQHVDGTTAMLCVPPGVDFVYPTYATLRNLPPNEQSWLRIAEVMDVFGRTYPLTSVQKRWLQCFRSVAVYTCKFDAWKYLRTRTCFCFECVPERLQCRKRPRFA